MFEDIKKEDKEYVMNTYGRFDLAIKSGKGAICQDFDGKTYIDFGSGIGVTSLGYCEDGWINAVCNQAKTLNHTSNLYYTKPCIDLAKKLCDYSNFSKVFFANSGAEANEGAIKIARKYGMDKYGEHRTKVITLVNSFHGRTVTTLAATGQEEYHKSFFPLTGGFDYAEANNIEKLISKIDENTTAIMLEFIQGEGGVIPLDKDFVNQIYSLCKEKDILLIADEVQTGIGRTGKLFAYENYNVTPDIITCAKGLGGGLPIGAILARAKVSNVLATSDHGSTFGGNPISCAGANYVIDTVATPEFLTTVEEKGNYIKTKLSQIVNVKQIRQMGLMIGIEVEGKSNKDIAKECLENGLLVLTAKSAVRLLPPLTISYDEIDNGIKILENIIFN